MKRLLASCLVVFLCGVVSDTIISPCFVASRAGAAESTKTTAPILVERCHIKLMKTAVLSSARVGVLKAVDPEEGDLVNEGDLVAVLQDELPRATCATAKKRSENDVSVRYAQKSENVAEAELQKAHYSNDLVPNTVPDIEVRRLDLAWQKATLSIEQAQHELEVNRLLYNEALAELETYHVLAPFTGVVVRVYKHKGEGVNQGEPILEMVSTSSVKVEGYVPFKDAYRIKPGDRVRVKLDLPEVDLPVEKKVFDGKIVFVDVTVQPVLQQVRVWAEVVNQDNILRAGLSAQMAIESAAK